MLIMDTKRIRNTFIRNMREIKEGLYGLYKWKGCTSG